MAFTKGKSMAADFRAAKGKSQPKNDRQRLFKGAIAQAKKQKKGVPVYVGYSQVGKSDEFLDKMHKKAILPGWRVSAPSKPGQKKREGLKLYKEVRKNRSDRSGRNV